MHDLSEMNTAVCSLKAEMTAAGLIPASETSSGLDVEIAKLSADQFLSLRTLPAFWQMLALCQRPADIEHSATLQAGPQRSLPQINRDASDPAVVLNSLTDAMTQVGSNASSLLPHPLTPIEAVQLGGRFDKLITRLCRSAKRSAIVTVNFNRLEDIIKLPIETLLKLDGVGKAYREDWQELTYLYSRATEFLPLSPDLPQIINPLELVQKGMRLNLTQLDAPELKVVAKLERVLGYADIHSILTFDSIEGDSWLGRGTKNQLMQLRARIVAELQLIADGVVDYHAAPTSLICATTQSFESVAALGEYLLDRLDIFLATVDEKSQLIFQHRWGFVDERLTLSEIGTRYNVSRERIRQLEGKINERLESYLALDSPAVWQPAACLPRDALRLEMENLAGCFAEPPHFYEFLTFVSNGRIAHATTSTTPSLKTLDSYFALHGLAVEEFAVLQYLKQELGGDELVALDTLNFLRSEGQIAIESGFVRPLNLGKRDAAAAVLTGHPNGLPWLDIARQVNRCNVSGTRFSEKTGGYALQDSELMYVAGKGVYRHTCFVDFSTFDEPAIFQALHAFFATSEREVAHLNEVHASSPELRKHDYYILRYVVKMHGENQGIYFNGKSQTDSISLNPGFELISQKSVILRSMRQAQGPLTNVEVAQLLKSRSSKHASLYLKQLMDDNQVVQVDRMLYTIPDHAYRDIDLDTVRSLIESVLARFDKPVDPSVIQHDLNLCQGGAYSKYFYNSLARYFAQLGHWHRRHSLFALRPMSFGSLTDVINTHCKMENTIDQNVACLSLHVAIQEEAARVSIYNWKAAKVRFAPGVAVPELEQELEDEIHDGEAM